MSVKNVEAVKSAGERLEAIEAWSRRTFIAATVAASFLGVMASAVGYVGYEYVRARWAMAEVAERLSKKAPEPAAGGLTFDPARGINDLKARFTGPGGKAR